MPERLRGSRQKDETKLRRELVDVERGIARCLEFILSDEGAPASVRSKLQDLEASNARLEAELASINAALPSVEIHPNMPDLSRRRVAALADLLEDEDTRPEAMEIIRSLIERIEVGPPDGEHGPCTVTLIGALASVLSFVADQQGQRLEKSGQQVRRAVRPGSTTQESRPRGSGFLGTCLLVAGAGFEPAAFRL